ncbi:putative protease [Marinomonas sp. MED121]|uniref:DJ-1/PfpI family protein n=1 Tax=Marinomonas sp. MED121 TaxID=314277 RepID=UPI0000690F12|nr:DJ-1/PfpI family protein [Marinomonas sp. MED121]EAQ64237.1 putative protease [Marinomonas sp. MED121]
MPSVLVPIANGSEDIEAITIIDVLRRGGVEVVVASVHDSLQITAARGSKIEADVLLSELETYVFEDGSHYSVGEALDENVMFDAIALPGGIPGAEHLRDSELLVDILEKHDIHDAILAAICAAPALVLGTHGFVMDKQATCYPGFEDGLTGAQYVADQPVVMDENIMTSQGPATAMVFSLSLLANLIGYEKTQEVAAGLLC